MFVIGEKVRLMPVEADGLSTTAMVSYIHEMNGEQVSVDLIFERSSANTLNQEEETEVPLNRLQKLLPFEMLSKSQLLEQHTATAIKDFGNQLFHVKDFIKSMEFYQLSLQAIDQHEKEACFSLGTPVIVFSEEIGDFLYGIVSSNDDFSAAATYEIMLSNDEERHIPAKDLTVIPPNYENQLLQRSLYSNLGKCAVKRVLRGWAIRYGSLALILTRAMISLAQDTGLYDEDGEKRKKLQQLLVDALFFRGKALILASRPVRAMADCRELKGLDGKKAQSLEAEITAFKTKRQKDNRKLAKEIAKWVDASLSQAPASATASLSADAPISDDADEDF